jgi:hypothetical protein
VALKEHELEEGAVPAVKHIRRQSAPRRRAAAASKA